MNAYGFRVPSDERPWHIEAASRAANWNRGLRDDWSANVWGPAAPPTVECPHGGA